MSLLGAWQERRERWSRRPFWRLAAHFGSRLFAGSGESEEGALELGVGAILALLASPGAFVTILLFQKYSSTIRFFLGQRNFDPYSAALPDQYFFITFSLVITGMVTVLKWDSIFPDRRDYMNLAPLPIPTRAIFLANITAILTIALIFAVDVNAVSSICFPVLVTMEKPGFSYYVQFASIHFIGVLLASLFIFFAMFALIGTLMLALPQSVFRRISLAARVGVVVLLLVLLFTGFAVPPLLRTSPDSRLLTFLPPVWFLGFSRSLMGIATPQLARLGLLGIKVTAATLVLAAGVYVLSYYRYFIRIPEMLEITSRSRASGRGTMWRLLDRLILRTPFERACYRFTIKTLFRNERHTLFLGSFIGLGLVIAAQGMVSAFATKPAAVPSADYLSLPFVLSFFIIGGLRFVFEIPAELRANWVHQMVVDVENHQAASMARKVMLTLVWPWVIAFVLPLYAWRWGLVVALAHTSVVLVWSYGLAGLLLRGFRKIPFTCPHSPWRQHAAVMIVMYVFGFFAYASITPDIEHRLLVGSPWMAIGFAALGLAWERFWLRRHDEFEETTLVFDHAEAPPFQMLNLSRN
ncbi:MAG TPA: hypothetical protein VF532_17835 [Candidatus Angelobacter sp.]